MSLKGRAMGSPSSNGKMTKMLVSGVLALSGSPVIIAPDPDDHLTVLLIPVGRFSDGTPAPVM